MPFLDIDGARLHYQLTGSDEPALVLIHGGGCTQGDWRLQVEALSGKFAMLTMDLRCHGQSTGSLAGLSIERWASDINALVEHLGLAPAIFIGHSLAARIAAAAVWQRPANAAGLILLDGSRSVGGFAAAAPEEPAPVPGAARSLAEIIDATIGRYANARVRDHIQQTMSAHSMELLFACAAAYEAWDRDKADTVFAGLPPALPMLAIQSSYHDKRTPRRYLTGSDRSTPYLDFLRSVRPSIRVELLPDTGHFAMLERPDEVTGLIRDFAGALKTC